MLKPGDILLICLSHEDYFKWKYNEVWCDEKLLMIGSKFIIAHMMVSSDVILSKKTRGARYECRDLIHIWVPKNNNKQSIYIFPRFPRSFAIYSSDLTKLSDGVYLVSDAWSL